MRDTKRHPDVEKAEGLIEDNHRFAASPVGPDMAGGIMFVLMVVCGIALRLLVFN